MATPNLDILHLLENQDNKEVTINDGFDQLDDAMNSILSVDITSGGANLTLTQFRNHFAFRCTGSPSVAPTLTLPTGVERCFAVINDTIQSLSVEFEDAASDALTLASGGTAVFHTDGTLLFSLTASESGTTRVTKTGDFDITDEHLSGNYILEVDSGTDVTVSVESGLAGVEPVTLIQSGAGQIVLHEGSGVSILAPDGATKSRVRYSTLSLIPAGPDTFYLTGDIAV